MCMSWCLCTSSFTAMYTIQTYRPLPVAPCTPQQRKCLAKPFSPMRDELNHILFVCLILFPCVLGHVEFKFM